MTKFHHGSEPPLVAESSLTFPVRPNECLRRAAGTITCKGATELTSLAKAAVRGKPGAVSKMFVLAEASVSSAALASSVHQAPSVKAQGGVQKRSHLADSFSRKSHRIPLEGFTGLTGRWVESRRRRPSTEPVQPSEPKASCASQGAETSCH